MQEELQVTHELLTEYLEAQKNAGLSENSIASYRRKLRQLYELLPEDKTIRRGTLLNLGEELAEKGYSAQSINVFFTAADGLAAWCGHYELQTRSRRPQEEILRPELTRTEYRWLLSMAKTLGRIKTYYLIKCFATLGVNPKDLHTLTVEAVQAGSLRGSDGMTYIPESFREELLRYAREEGIVSGPIFLGRSGKPIERTSINKMILNVQQNTRVAAEKCNPRCLRKLYQSTQEELQSRVRLLMEQEYNRLLQRENDTVGWYTDWDQKRSKVYPRTPERERGVTVQR